MNQNNPYGAPVAYSAAVRRSIALIEKQITYGEDWLKFSTSDLPRVAAEHGRITGLAIALTTLAENHRQWDDFGRWSAIQGRHAAAVSDLTGPGARAAS